MTQVIADAPVARPRFRFRLLIAAVALVAWTLITVFDPLRAGRAATIVGSLAEGPAWSILFAGVFLVILMLACRWRDIGLNLPPTLRSLKLLWFPAIYLLLFFALDALVGPPPLIQVGFLVLNTALAAFSEELMFRGVMYGALRTRLGIWPSAIIATLLFGAVHALNIGVIGDIGTTGAQVVAATMSGLLFIAIRVRTDSLVPGMVYHALWDLSTLLAVVKVLSGDGAAAAGNGGAASPSPVMLLLPILFVLPNFIYALVLLRRAGRLASPPSDVAPAAAS
jgi:membrane protease YdiL (CAAX protease family)